jgi:hypothetical protein
MKSQRSTAVEPRSCSFPVERFKRYNARPTVATKSDELGKLEQHSRRVRNESSIQEHIANVTLRRRIVQLEPLLIEVAATEVAGSWWRWMIPTVQHIIENCFAAGTQEYSWTPAGYQSQHVCGARHTVSFFAWRADNPRTPCSRRNCRVQVSVFQLRRMGICLWRGRGNAFSWGRSCSGRSLSIRSGL